MQESTRIVTSFASMKQIPYLMIVKEYRDEIGEVVHADVLYCEEKKESEVIVFGKDVDEMKVIVAQNKD